MGTTRIKVIDLSQDVEQVKTARKRAQTAAVREVKKPLVEKKPPKVSSKPTRELVEKPQILEKTVTEKILSKEAVPSISKKKITQKMGKKYRNAKLLLDQTKFYPIDAALELVKKINIARFAGSVEAHIIVKQKAWRAVITLPHPFGKKLKILVFAPTKLAIPTDGITLANEKTIEEIEARKLVPKRDFNLIIATPEFMPKLAKLGKFLGPAGLIPNPKAGTVTDKPEEVVKKFSSGTVEVKTEPSAPVIHTLIGKISQDTHHLKENLQALLAAINLQQVRKLYLAPTMGPSVKVDLTTLMS